MINERLFPNIVRKTDNDEEYVNDPTAKRFPLLQLYDEISQEQDTPRILLVGEGSIGKSTSLRLLQAELMIRGIYCARYECRHLNDRSIPDIRKEMEQWPKDTVVMIDAYDELPGAYTKELDELVNEFANAKFPLIVTSRSKPEANVYEEMAHYEVCPFADQQIEKILEKEQVPPTAPCYGLLHNTMFLAIYLYLDKYKHEYSINMDDLEDEASFLLTYFHALFLSKDTKTKAEDREQKAIPRVETSLAHIGEVVFMNRTEEEIEEEPELPEALNNIVTQKKDDDLGYIITATQIKYENFFVALYMMKELLPASNKKDIDRARRLFDISLMDDHTDAYVYAGQLLRRQEKGKAVLGWLNDEKVYPKSFCEGYTHVLLLYLGMNKGCFNCGEIDDLIFFPKIFALYSYWIRKSPNDYTTVICDHAFMGCRHLKSICFSQEISSIGHQAFANSSLCSVTITNNVISIREMAFACCNNLRNIVIPEGVSLIGNYAFSLCTQLQSVFMSNSVSSIGYGLFRGCVNLERVTLSNRISQIGRLTFEGCRKLQSIYIPDAVVRVGEAAFANCIGLHTIHLPKNAEVIESRVFSGCLELRNIDLPPSVRYIGEETFSMCKSLEKLIVPPQITQIEFALFSKCTHLKHITLHDSITSIGPFAFAGCTLLQSVVIPKNVTSISMNAFDCCRSLKSVVISSSVHRIGESAFQNCSNLETVAINPFSELYQIARYAFSGCSSLKHIDIPDEVNTIGTAAFQNCLNLESVSFLINASFLDTLVINGQAFSGCSRLKNITIPNIINSIDEKTFWGCNSLTFIRVPECVKVIEPYAFGDCCNIATVVLLSSSTQISQSAFSSPFTAYVPRGSTPWYRSQLPPSCTIIETDFEQNIDIEQENDLTQ